MKVLHSPSECQCKPQDWPKPWRATLWSWQSGGTLGGGEVLTNWSFNETTPKVYNLAFCLSRLVTGLFLAPGSQGQGRTSIIVEVTSHRWSLIKIHCTINIIMNSLVQMSTCCYYFRPTDPQMEILITTNCCLRPTDLQMEGSWMPSSLSCPLTS